MTNQERRTLSAGTAFSASAPLFGPGCRWPLASPLPPFVADWWGGCRRPGGCTNGTGAFPTPCLRFVFTDAPLSPARLSGYLLLPLFLFTAALGATQTSWSQEKASGPLRTAVALCLSGVAIAMGVRLQPSKLPF